MPAMMEVWFPGTEAGNALADVLYGDTAPSGKLPMSFPYDVGQEPLYYSQFPTGRPASSVDLKPSPSGTARFVSRYLDMPNAALFPFGFGLSYTTFAYSNVQVSRPTVPLKDAHPGTKNLIFATATVKNTGTKAGSEVVQCYLRDLGTSLEQPMRTLKGFTRITLAPGESKSVSFPLGYDELSFYDNTGTKVLEPSKYTVWIGGNSLARLHTEFRVTSSSAQ